LPAFETLERVQFGHDGVVLGDFIFTLQIAKDRLEFEINSGPFVGLLELPGKELKVSCHILIVIYLKVILLQVSEHFLHQFLLAGDVALGEVFFFNLLKLGKTVDLPVVGLFGVEVGDRNIEGPLYLLNEFDGSEFLLGSGVPALPSHFYYLFADFFHFLHLKALEQAGQSLHGEVDSLVLAIPFDF
jgi:hypothetical protein